MPLQGLLLGLSMLTACRIENPGFFDADADSEIRDDESEQEESSTQEEDSSEEEKPSAKEDDEPSEGKPTPSEEESSSTSESATDEPGSSSEPSDVKDVCNKGASYCYDMRVVQDDSLDNKAPTNRDTGLDIEAADSAASPTSPTFGHRLRLGSASWAKTSKDIVVASGSSFGIDIWFSPDFSSSDSMILARVGELLSIEIRKDKSAECQIYAVNRTNKELKVEALRSKYFGDNKWQMVSCSLSKETLELWNLDASVAYSPLKLGLDIDLGVRVYMGANATKNLEGIVHGGFVGDVHLMRFWTKASNYDQVLREELRSFGLEPPN